MKRQVKKGIQLASFLAILLFIFTELTWQLRANPDHSMKTVIGFGHQDRVDVLLFGASSVHCNYQPMEAWNQKGYTSYDFSTHSNPLDLLKHQIAYTRETSEASLYVCDLHTLTSASASLEESHLRALTDSLPIFSPSRLRIVTSYLKKKDRTGLDIPSFYIDLIKYHTNYTKLFQRSKWPLWKRLQYKSLEKGFNPQVAENCFPFERPKATSETRALTQYQAFALNELLDYCDQEKLQVLFVCAPYILSESDWALFNSCADIMRERGYTFVNFNEYYDEIGLDFETDFSDTNHLNYFGSEKYTNYLMNYLCENYDLPDHRGDPAYASWADDYAAYAKSSAEWRDGAVATVQRQLEAKEIGERLPLIEDPATWFELVQNESFTVIVEKNGPSANISDPVSRALYAKMTSDWEIDEGDSSYAGIWCGGECLFASGDAETYEGEIGVYRGKRLVPTTVRAGKHPELTVGDRDYANDLGGIQAVVFDNNYHRVVDCVNIIPDANGIRLVR